MENEGFIYRNMSSEEVLRSMFEDAAKSLLAEHGSFVLGVSTRQKDYIGSPETSQDNVGKTLSKLQGLARTESPSTMGWFIIPPSEVQKLNPNRVIYAEDFDIEG